MHINHLSIYFILSKEKNMYLIKKNINQCNINFLVTRFSSEDEKQNVILKIKQDIFVTILQKEKS